MGGSNNGTGITHWLINETVVKPAINDPGWVAINPCDFIVSEGYGPKTVSAWVKDAALNVSDTTVSLFSINPTSRGENQGIVRGGFYRKTLFCTSVKKEKG